MPRDRDILIPKHLTPPAGTKARAPSVSDAAAVTAADAEDFAEESELTPIEGASYEAQAAGRAKQAAASSRTAVKLVRELARSHATLAGVVEEVRGELKEYAENDKRDHAELRQAVAEVRGDVSTITDHVTDVRVDMGKILGKLEVMQPEYDLKKKNEAHEKRVAASIRGAFWKTLLKVAGAIVTAGGVALAGYAVHACTHGAPSTPAETHAVAPK